MKYTQSAYNKSFDLYMKYGPIVVRPTTQDTKALDELVRMCDTEEKYSLIEPENEAAKKGYEYLYPIYKERVVEFK